MLARMSLHFSVSEQARLAHNCLATCLLHFALSQRWQHMSRQHQLLSIIPKKWRNDLVSSTVYYKSMFAKTFLFTSLFKLAGFTREKKNTSHFGFRRCFPAFRPSIVLIPTSTPTSPPLAPLEALPIASSASGPPRSPWAKSSTRSPGRNDGRHGGHVFGERFR